MIYWEESADSWRTIVVALLSILVALIAVVYRDLSRRLHNLESATREDFVPRKEYDTTVMRIEKAVERIEKAVDRRRTGE